MEEKVAFFPLAAGSEYLSENGHENEIPMLIDPCKEDDVKLISFMGNRVISTSHNEFDKARVEISTNIYNLDNPYIKVDRRKVWDEVEKLIEEYQSGEISKKSCLRRLSDMVDKKTMFSACAIACINSMAPDEIKNDLDLKI